MDAQSDVAMKFKRIGIVGAGNMGSMMGFAFSELGLDVSIWDVKSANINGVLSKLRPEPNEGDIIMDGGNEHYLNTKRRQKECRDIGVDWIGMGVSGGYQSARHGPSLSPGGDNAALEEVMPLLELYAAKDPKSGVSCVSSIGPGGSGHL
ncbi:6-phosphogluconate dehydrogenase, decarboxylating [Metarhizium brunneum]|uniref:6-phosphogluconate dehydrogenase, decarboxylating n=1 Tax=Metarhizium brunneum TaxID=500148 RepID=A0A7D5Z385_9HYPO